MLDSLFVKDSLLETGKILLSKEETLAVAESVTCGFLQAAYSTVPDAAKFFHGGITAYNLGQKCRHLSIEPIHAQACNCVSDKVAGEMAANVCNLFSSHWGIGVTGYAAPVPESDNAVFAYYSITYKGKVIVERKIEPEQSDPIMIQLLYVNEIIKAFLHCLHEQGKHQV